MENYIHAAASVHIASHVISVEDPGGGGRGKGAMACKNRPKKMAAKCLYFMFVAPPLQSFWIRYWIFINQSDHQKC